MANQSEKSFGHVLREKREGRFSLRSFAKLVGVSPTYLSQVEQGNAQPPTADRVKRRPNSWAKTRTNGLPWPGGFPKTCRRSFMKSRRNFRNCSARPGA